MRRTLNLFRMNRFAFNFICRNFKSLPLVLRRNILQDTYKCSEAWRGRLNSEILSKIKVDELYYDLDQKYNRAGNISAVDVDIFVNAVDSVQYVDELRDLLHKLRQTSETANTFDSTHYATIRHFIDFDRTDDLLNILDDRLNYGVFVDVHSSLLLFDHFFRNNDFKSAARIACLLMLQEDFLCPLTAELSTVACLKYLADPKPFYPVPEKAVTEEVVVVKKKKIEEIKIRVGFLRNPYFDDHFDIRNENELVGKTLAMLYKRHNNIEGLNGQIVGWTLYKKYDKLLDCVERAKASPKPEVFQETISVLEDKLKSDEYKEGHDILNKVLTDLQAFPLNQGTLLECAKERTSNEIKNSEEVLTQEKIKILSSWEDNRKIKLEEQITRLDRAKRIENIENTQRDLETEEEKLWFFENEGDIDLKIEKKKIYYRKRWFGRKKPPKEDAKEYIPPEILRRRK